MSNEEAQFKVKSNKQGGFAAYRALVYGDQPMVKVILAELLTLLFGSLPGALGLGIRSALYPLLFPEIGKKVIFGRNITLRHTHKIRIGDGVVIDDNAMLDAKGVNNSGIELGDGVYIGRHTLVYCKGGNIVLGPRVNVSSNCQIFSSNSLRIGGGCMIGAYSYFLSGGEYDRHSEVPYADQDGMETKGPLEIGANCWFGARVTVLDGASIGENSVLAAGAVITKPLPAGSLAGGVPARDLRK